MDGREMAGQQIIRYKNSLQHMLNKMFSLKQSGFEFALSMKIVEISLHLQASVFVSEREVC